MSLQEPNLEEWKRLYEGAAQLQALSPWNWMEDADVFGVQNPANEEIGYCCVMGNLGEHFALATYLGTEGLNCILKMSRGEGMNDPMELLLIQKCLMVSFEDRNMMESGDFQTIKALGLKFRGKKAWPQFRSYRPGYAPWYLTQEEALFLTLAVQQTLEVSLRFKDAPDLFNPQKNRQRSGQFRVRVPQKTQHGLEWHDTWLTPAPITPKPVVSAALDEVRVQRLAKTAKRTSGILEMDYFFSPAGVKEKTDERPWYPYVILALDRDSGMPLCTEMTRPDEIHIKFGEALLTLLEQMGQLPKEIQVVSETAVQLLEPITSLLKIHLKRVRSLPSMEMLRDSLFEFMG